MVRKVKRRRFIESVGVAGAVGLAGCSQGSDSPTETGNQSNGAQGDDTVMLEWAASQEEASEQEAFNDALHEAGLSEDIRVEFLSGGDVTEDRREQYQRWLSSGRSTPDLLRVDNGWTIPFIARDQLLNLSDHMSEDFSQRIEEEYFDPAVATATGQDGGVYALPLWVGLPTMLYRKDLVEEAGHDPDGENWATEPLTWQAFSTVVEDVKANSDVDQGFVFQGDAYAGLACCTFNEFMTTWGGAYFGGVDNLFGPVGDRPVTVADQKVEDSIRMVRTFVHGNDDPESLDGYAGNIAPEAVTNWTEQETNGAFQDGNAAFMRNWPYFVGVNGADDEFGEDLGVMPLPQAVSESESEYSGTGGSAAALGGWHVAVNPNTEYREEALAVVEAAMSDEFNYAIFELLGQIPPKSSLLDTDRARDIETVGRYVDAYQVAGRNAIPRPVTVVWPDQSQLVYQEVNAAYSQQKAPDEALADLESGLEEIETSV